MFGIGWGKALWSVCVSKGDVLYLPTYSSVSVLAIPLRTLCSEGSRDREETDVRNRLGESFMECMACFWLMASGPE
ncbi:hypothetical protein NDU88_001646 [Pleurodeles waltl]|uniref:Uncharacterized protein n=1 Tax=Pleurodeles waltl TaxID=8319 RepID=A0AAV7P4F7_PLEWA|nr:hypothetical protein NDU88_001646 [Pleurodeles waltl]